MRVETKISGRGTSRRWAVPPWLGLVFLLHPSLASASEISTEPVQPENDCTNTDQDQGADPCPVPVFETVVTARPPPPVGTHSRIDAAEIERRGAHSLAEALALEPGIEINRSPKQGSSLQVRGFDERAVLLTVEGIPIREVYAGYFDISSLPAQGLGAIEIERGVTSLLYGPNSAGGIIALRAPTKCNHVADLSVFGRQPHRDTVQAYGATAVLCHRFSALTFHLSGGYDHSSGYLLSHRFEPRSENAQFHEDGGIREGSDHDRGFVALLAKYAPRRHQSLSLFVDGVHAPRGIPLFEGSGYLRRWRFTAYDTLLVGISGSYGPPPEQLPATWGFRGVEGQLYLHLHRDELRDYEDEDYARLTTDPLAWFVASAYANETFGAAVRVSWSLNEGNRLETTLRYNLDLHRQSEIPVPRNNEETDWTAPEHYWGHTFAAAIEDTQVFGSWRLKAGVGASGMSLLAQELRGQGYPVSQRLLPGVEGRLLAEKSFGDDLRFNVAAGHKVRFPTLKELFSNYVGGNPHLETERAWMAEIGFDARHLGLVGLDVSLRLFANLIEELIERYRDAYANIGRAVTAGGELEVRYRPFVFLQLLAGYRYLLTHDLESDRQLDYRTPHRVIAGLRLLTDFGLSGALEATYNSGQRAYYFDSIGGLWQEDRLPDFLLVNARLRYELEAGETVRVYLYADGRNLFDTNYYLGSFEPRPGRELTFGIGGRL